MACVDSHASDAGLGAISPGLSLDALTDGRATEIRLSFLCDSLEKLLLVRVGSYPSIVMAVQSTLSSIRN